MQINRQTKQRLRSPVSKNRAKPIKDVMKYLSANKEDPSCHHVQAVEIQNYFVNASKVIIKLPHTPDIYIDKNYSLPIIKVSVDRVHGIYFMMRI